jgi:hypothetical protein
VEGLQESFGKVVGLSAGYHHSVIWTDSGVLLGKCGMYLMERATWLVNYVTLVLSGISSDTLSFVSLIQARARTNTASSACWCPAPRPSL